jgi:hypothetical protein
MSLQEVNGLRQTGHGRRSSFKTVVHTAQHGWWPHGKRVTSGGLSEHSAHVFVGCGAPDGGRKWPDWGRETPDPGLETLD